MSTLFETFFAQEALDQIAVYLGSRDHSEKELKEKLKKKDFTEPEIQAALLKAKDHGWILPPQELSQKVTQSLYRKKKGHHAIQAFLKKKGLPPTKHQPDQELQNAFELIKQSPKFKKLSGYELRKKVFLFLSHRGYDRSTINVLLEDLKESEFTKNQ